jgi:hypothetical protein
MYSSGISMEGMRKMMKKLIGNLKPTGGSEYETEISLTVGRKDEHLTDQLSDFHIHTFRKLYSSSPFSLSVKVPWEVSEFKKKKTYRKIEWA